jgi:hypothetical protein
MAKHPETYLAALGVLIEGIKINLKPDSPVFSVVVKWNEEC